MRSLDEPSKVEDLLAVEPEAGPAKRISSSRSSAIVDAVMEASQETEPVPSPAKTRARGVFGWLALAAVVVAGTAGANVYYNLPAEPAPEPVERPVRTVDEADVEPAPSASTPARPEPVPLDQPVEDIHEEPLVEPGREAAPAEDFLSRANALRRERRWEEAARVYARVVREHAGTDEAYVASVAAASLYLVQLGSPARALELYESALRVRPMGTLSEEARFGSARCHRALGNREAESSSLRDFVETHPGSPLRGRAQARLDEIDLERREDEASTD